MIDNGIYPQDPSLEILAHPELSKQGFWMQDWIDKLVLDTAALWTAKGIGKFDPFETLCWGRSSRPRFCFFCGFWKQRIMQTHWVAQGSASRVCCLVGDTAQLSQTKIAPGVRSLLIWWWWLDFSSAICCGHISIWNRRSIALFVSSSPISLEGYNTLGIPRNEKGT